MEIPQPSKSDLSLIPLNDILQELKNRFPHMIFMGKKYLDDKGMWVTSDTSQGDANICAGLGMEIALKNVYFKLITQIPTDKF